MVNAVTVTTEGYALSLCFLDSFGNVVLNDSEFIDRPLVPTDDMMKVDDGWVTEATVGALLF